RCPSFVGFHRPSMTCPVPLHHRSRSASRTGMARRRRSWRGASNPLTVPYGGGASCRIRPWGSGRAADSVASGQQVVTTGEGGRVRDGVPRRVAAIMLAPIITAALSAATVGSPAAAEVNAPGPGVLAPSYERYV